ncbi:hypothetical protein FHG87_002607 [Trinorchestia longiramus]|nr:hypothetical protein FHG87_002607 [Trinorchestia longiramus]
MGPSSTARVRRGFFGGGGGYGGGGGGYGGGNSIIGTGGYSGSSVGTHVLLAGGGGGYGGAGAAAHTLNAGSGPAYHPIGGPEQQWYTNIANAAGSVYDAKTIAQGQFQVAQANAAAASAAQGIYASANDPGLAASAQYAAQHAQNAELSAAAHNGQAAVVTGAAFNSYH